MNIEHIWSEWPDAGKFSGVFSVSGEHGVLFEKCCGFRNESEKLENNNGTAFGIASGTKMFTALAVCKLIDDKQLRLEDRLCDIVPHDLGQVDKRVTVFHLLTHTSGIGDYLDEESPNFMSKLQSLYDKYPVYLWERLEYYLPMIAPLPPKFEPGARYGYSNAGYILLGLIIEAVSGVSYQRFVEEMIIAPLNLTHTGFYRMNCLPANTALGYIHDGKTGSPPRTNIFSLPIIGGSDGGLFTCAADLDKLWRAVFSNKIFSKDMTRVFLKPHVTRDSLKSYGLGVYLHGDGENLVYYAVGGDFGVDFFTAYFPKRKFVFSALGNSQINTFPLLKAILGN